MVTNTLCAISQNPTLHEIHHGTIRAHHAKARYDYPTIRLPFTFSGLIGLSTRIYQTVHDGALAFLVVVSSAATEKGADQSEDAVLNAKSPALTWRKSPVRILQKASFFLQSAAKIMADDEHNGDEKSHTLMRLKNRKNRQTTTVTTPPLRDIWKRGCVSVNCKQNSSS